MSNIYYDYISVINWNISTLENLQAFLECYYQLEYDEMEN